MDTPADYAQTPQGQCEKWKKEFEASDKFFRSFRKRGEKVTKRFLDEREGQFGSAEEDGDYPLVRESLNLFHSNITTLESMLYGSTPKVEVSRTFADASDDVARVASLILSRILQQDIEAPGENYSSVLRQALGDRLRPGLGCARLKYNAKFGVKQVPEQRDPVTNEVLAEGYEQEFKEAEWVDTVYTHWKDIDWSPARTYEEIRWKRFRAWMTRDEFINRFGETYVSSVEFKSSGPMNSGEDKDPTLKVAWDQAEIWEVWDKTTRKVYWMAKGCDVILDTKDDPLGLDDFWPDAPPLVANVTTSKYIPKADYDFARGIYKEIDHVQTRISILTDACKLVGVYDANNEGVQRLLNEGVETQLIPVQNWASFAEKNGLQGSIQWLPIEDVVNTITQLSARLAQLIQQLYEVTGLSDILRGNSDPRASATAEGIKSKFASIRVQALQDEFARFASDLCRKKVEIISKHYDPQSIVAQSNILSTPDGQNQQLVQDAIQLIKNSQIAKWRIKIRPESLAMVDYAQLKQDRTEFLTGMATFLQSSAPIMELEPGAKPLLMELLKWSLAGFKGSNEVEGLIDRAIDQIGKQKPDNKPDPEQIKMQAEMQKAQAKIQEIQLKGQQIQESHKLELQKMQMEMQQAREEHRLEMQKLLLEFRLEVQKMQTQTVADAQQQAQQFAFNTAEADHAHALQMESADKQARARDKSGKKK